jgi:hypothetical protein
VARGLTDQPVLLLGTYRLDEARAHPRLRSLVRSLQRLGLAEEMTLTPLSADAVAKLATAILEGTPPEALLSFLQDRVVPDQGSGSRSAGLYELGFHLRTGSGGVHRLKAYREWLAGAKFQPAEIHELVDDPPLRLIIARKAGGSR